MNIPYVMKRCNGCGRWLVASAINFYRNKSKKDGLNTECKKCKAMRDKKYREANKEKVAERRKQYYEANKEKELEKMKQYYEANKEMLLEYHKQYCKANKEKVAEAKKQYYENNKDKILEQRKQYYEDNKEMILEYQKQYCEANKDKITERKKRYYENNKEKIAEWGKQYRQDNKDEVAERKKRYYEANKDKIAEYKKQHDKQYYQTPQGQVARFNGRQRRRAKEEQQGTGITKEQWLEMMNFFDWKCAYSGEALTNNTRSVDHIVPLNNNGNNMVWNMVPMTRSLNSSKKAKDMLEWYKEQSFYSEARLAKIYEWQEYAFNKWYKEEE